MTKAELLRQSTFGKRVAEEEIDALGEYFVRTALYDRILAGDVDVIYGAKGSGKSAIYFSLLKADNELFAAGILVKSGENPRGTPAFKDLVSDPPATEEEFRCLWKLYCLSLIGSVLRDFKVPGDETSKVISYLESAELLPRDGTLAALIRRSLDYVRNFGRLESIEGGLKLDPVTGLPAGLTGKITLREPAAAESKAGLESLDALLALANAALRKANYKLWILLDRLDVAFADSSELEANALRALFKAYLDLSGLDNVRLKIFLRSDIWKRITETGFRESSHITRHATIAWTDPSLLNLVIRRVLSNKAIREYYGVSEEQVLSNYEAQVGFFYKVFPDKVDPGQKKPKTFDWMLSRTRDGLGIAAPRELIHLLNSLQEMQLAKYDLGAAEPSQSYLFDRICFKEAMREVSRVRVEQTIYAEYPEVKPWVAAIEGEKTEQSIESLAELWGVKKEEAVARAQRLVDIGFFEGLGKKDSPRFKVPFLYRNYLALLQGKADQPGYTDEDSTETLFTLSP
jgi:hypothetical protein